MYSRHSNTNVTVRAVTASLLLVGVIVAALCSEQLEPAFSQTRRTARSSRTAAPAKYSSFPHDAKAHRLECGTCHKFPSANWDKVRSSESAFPDITDYPKHESCLACHRPQFFRGRPPVICSICHTTPGPRGGTRHPFPNPRELFDVSRKGKTASISDFEISFPHDKHIEIVTGGGVRSSVFINASFAVRRAAEESCAVCHTTLQPQGDSDQEYATKPPADLGDGFWLKKGTFKTVPIGHTTCFTCHLQDSGMAPAPTDCATCHKLRQPAPPADFDPKLSARMAVTDRVTLDAWRTRHSAGTFRHEFQSHSEMSCDTCHNVQAMNTLDPSTKRVPVSACATCHATATADDGGVINYEINSRKTDPAFQCVKCHVVFGKQPVPKSHTQAIIDAGGTP